jgi:hypothetical protein
MVRRDRWMASAFILGGAASWGMGGRPAPAADPAMSDAIRGSGLERVVLTQKAAERLAIRTEGVREEPVMRWTTVSGEVEAATVEQTPPAAAGSAAAEAAPADAAQVLVRVPLLDDRNQVSGQASLVLSLGGEAGGGDENDNESGDEEGGNQDQAAGAPKGAFVLPIGDERPIPLRARPIQATPEEAAKAQYYAVNAAGFRLSPGQHVNVRVPQPGSGTPQKVIPYSALMYDVHGDAWVYTNPEPLVFVRQPVTVEYVEGDLAVLKEGPAAGTPVVTVGAVELLGSEKSFGH